MLACRALATATNCTLASLSRPPRARSPNEGPSSHSISAAWAVIRYTWAAPAQDSMSLNPCRSAPISVPRYNLSAAASPSAVRTFHTVAIPVWAMSSGRDTRKS